MDLQIIFWSFRGQDEEEAGSSKTGVLRGALRAA